MLVLDVADTAVDVVGADKVVGAAVVEEIVFEIMAVVLDGKTGGMVLLEEVGDVVALLLLDM